MSTVTLEELKNLFYIDLRLPSGLNYRKRPKGRNTQRNYAGRPVISFKNVTYYEVTLNKLHYSCKRIIACLRLNKEYNEINKGDVKNLKFTAKYIGNQLTLERLKELVYLDLEIPQGLRWKSARGNLVPKDSPCGTFLVSNGSEYYYTNIDRARYNNSKLIFMLKNNCELEDLNYNFRWR